MNQEQLKEDMKTAMKSGDKLRLSTIRMLLSALKYVEIDKGEPLTEEEIFAVIVKEVKKRKEAIDLYNRGGREDLAEKEAVEARILQAYLPAELSEEELRALVAEVVAVTGAQGVKDMGRVMSEVMPRVKGRADGAKVSALVKERLG